MGQFQVTLLMNIELFIRCGTVSARKVKSSFQNILMLRSLTEDIEILFNAAVKFQFEVPQMSILAFGICSFSVFTHGSNNMLRFKHFQLSF